MAQQLRSINKGPGFGRLLSVEGLSFRCWDLRPFRLGLRVYIKYRQDVGKKRKRVLDGFPRMSRGSRVLGVLGYLWL
jgi:hypothetical protein